MDKFIVNIIHRPEMVPEYSATVTGQGKEEDIGDKKLICNSDKGFTHTICKGRGIHLGRICILSNVQAWLQETD